MTPYEDLTSACLAHGVMPAVVPQLKTITLGGAVAGVGIESSSHRYGLVHDTMLELDVLLGDGRVVSCTADNEHADLFFGFPNSYGTLGYALRVKAKTIPVKKYVHLDASAVFRCRKLFFRAGKTARCRRCRLCRRHGVLALASSTSRSAASATRRLTPAITPTRTSTTARSPRSAKTT